MEQAIPVLIEFLILDRNDKTEISAMSIAKNLPPTSEAILNMNKIRGSCAEKHYSVPELAGLWNLSNNTIRRIFENEPGVLRWGNAEARFRRRYTTLRIPETVMRRVHHRLRTAGEAMR